MRHLSRQSCVSCMRLLVEVGFAARCDLAQMLTNEAGLLRIEARAGQRHIDGANRLAVLPYGYAQPNNSGRIFLIDKAKAIAAATLDFPYQALLRLDGVGRKTLEPDPGEISVEPCAILLRQQNFAGRNGVKRRQVAQLHRVGQGIASSARGHDFDLVSLLHIETATLVDGIAQPVKGTFDDGQ